MIYATADPTKKVNVYFRVNRDGNLYFVFVTPSNTPYSLAGISIVVNFKKREDDTTNFLQLSTGGSGLSIVGNALTLTLSKANATTFAEQTYFWEMIRTKNGTDKNWLTGDAIFHKGKFDGVTQYSKSIINSFEDMLTIIIADSGGASSGLVFTDFTATNDVYPNSSATKGQLFKQLNFAFYGGVGYDVNSVWVAMIDNPGQNPANWKPF